MGRPVRPTAPVAAAVDTHTHLNHPRLRKRLPQVLERAHQAGVEQMIVVGYDLPSSESAVELSMAHPSLWAAVGVHPHDAKSFDDTAREALVALAASPRVAAIGETGLDFYRDLSPRERQREAFQAHARMARDLSLPLIVHCRQAQEEMLAVADELGAEGWVRHCFDAAPAQARRAVEMGMWIGVTGTGTYQHASSVRQAVAEVPLERMLLETDCPYLSPAPGRARDNEPANVVLVAEAMARIRGVEVETVVRATAENARAAFRLGEGRQSAGRGIGGQRGQGGGG